MVFQFLYAITNGLKIVVCFQGTRLRTRMRSSRLAAVCANALRYCAAKDEKYYGFRGHLVICLQQDLFKQALNLQTPKRSNMIELRDRNSVKRLVKTRRLIETSSGELRRASHGGVPKALIGQLAERFHFETVRARDLWHLTSRISRKLLAHTVALWLNRYSNNPFCFQQLIPD